MIINLQHPSAYSAEGTGTIPHKCGSWESLLTEVFSEVSTMEGFMKNLRKVAKKMRMPDEKELIAAGCQARGDSELKFIGNLFEVFGEYLVRTHENDDRLYVSNYSLMSIDDNGIDARATDSRYPGLPVFIQYKCYNEIEFFNGSAKPVLLTGSRGHIDSFVAECSMVVQDEFSNPLNWKWDRHHRMIVITTASDLHSYTKSNKYRDRVECVGAAKLRQLCDGNVEFWNDFRKSLNIV